MFGSRDDVGLGGVADDDARCGRGGDVHVVHADAGAPDHAQARSGRDQIGVDARGRAHDERVRARQGGRHVGARCELDDFAGGAQQIESRLGDRLGHDASTGRLIPATRR